MARTTLTVRDLRDIADRAARALCNRAETIEAREAVAAELVEIEKFADLIIGASGQGCAADAVILELGDDSEVR